MKQFSYKLYILGFIILNLIIVPSAFSQNSITSTNQGITITAGLTLTYCDTDPIDIIVGTTPDNKSFSGAGITDLGTINPATAEFDPSVAGVGSHTIKYNNKDYVFIVETMGVATLAAFAPNIYCETDPAFILTGGLPVDATGTYYVDGVARVNFDPAVEVGGTHWIIYTVGAACISSSAPQSIVVESIPVVTLAPFSDVCEGEAVFALSGGSPIGGTYSGPGVVAGNFDPALAGIGTHTVTYSIISGSCTNFDTETITVNALPVASFAGLGVLYCQTAVPVELIGTPQDANGVFSGTGVTNDGDGTGWFSPSVANLGTHTVTYTYTNVNLCVDVYTQDVDVGTVLTMAGIVSPYCVNDPVFTVVCTPGGGIFTPVAGLTDNMDGTADFDPAVAGVGSFVIEYEYDDGTCTSAISQTVDVLALPIPAIAGLAATYCTNDAPVIITGSPTDANGDFSGPGVVDNNDGTASFTPATPGAGGPYAVTYTYTNAAGCSESVTVQTTVLPIPTATILGDATICSGDLTPIDITLTGGAPYDFTYNDGIVPTNIVAHATNNYNTNVSPTSNKTYTVATVTDANGCTNSGVGSASIIVNPEVVITTHPLSKMVCSGSNTSFSVVANGLVLTYQWQKDAGDIVGATSSVLTLNNVAAADVASYTCIVSSSCGGPLTSNVATLGLNVTTAISVHPFDDYLCTGENLNLTVTASGTSLQYQWKKDGVDVVDGGNIIGATLSALTITSVTTANAGNYTCEVTGDCGTLLSNVAVVDIDAPIVIITQPVDEDACPGENISFTVTATGTNLTYQWQKNGIDIGGEISQSLIINSVAAINAGMYKCNIGSLCGESSTSNTVLLTINTPTQIITDPIDVTECLNNNTALEVTTSGTNLSYNWFKDGAVIPVTDGGSISGSSTNQLIFTGLELADAGEYICEVTGDCGVLTSNSADLVVDDAIVITTQPLSQTTCEGNNVIFSVVATGSNLTYQWQKDLVDVPGETNANLNLISVTNLDDGDYRCIISNSCGESVNSAASSLTIYDVTAIITQPTDAVECISNTIIFSVVATGSNLTYKWYKDGGALIDVGDISGSSTNNLTINNLDLADAGEYHCNVSGNCGTLNSGPAELTIDDNISITTEPSDIQACETDNITFSLVASGSNLSYQWQRDGVDILGATNSILSLNNITALDEASYRCVVSNSCSSFLISQTADLTLNEDVSITLHPIDETECIGQNVSFKITATGSVVSYQWYKNGISLNDFGNISGSATNTLNITGILTGDDGVYTCNVVGDCNTLNSDPGNLILNTLTTITTQPANQTICVDANAVFTVVASGTNLSYQWQKDGGNLIGKTNSGLIINNVTNIHAGIYRCIVTGDCGVSISNGALLNINTDVAITSDPADDEVCEDDIVGFEVTVTGSDLTYQWQLNGVDLANGVRISGVSTSNLTINPSQLGDAGVYSCIVTGSCGNQTSAPANLIVNEKTIISVQPQNKIACLNDNISFKVTVSGTDLLYQWQKDDSDILGETNSTLLLNNVAAIDIGIYRCIITGDCGIKTSNGASLDLNTDVTITTHPINDIACENEIVGFTVEATGTGLLYQWKHNGIDVVDFGNISGSNTNNLIIDPVSLVDAGAYSCEISGTCGSQNSNSVSLKVNENIVFSNHPQSKTGCPGEDITFNVIATGTNMTYVWQKDGAPVVGGTNSGLLLTNITALDAGTYRCVITGDCGTVFSNGAALTVNENVAIATHPANDEVCEGQSAGFVVAATGTGVVYQWKYNGVDLIDDLIINGSGTNSLTIDPSSLANVGVYTCDITGSCSVENSNPANLIIDEQVVITDHPVNVIACPAENVTFSISATGTGLTYQWQRNGGDIGGETNPGLTIFGVTDANDGIYTCIVTGDCGTSVSDGATLVVDEAVNITTQPTANPLLCEGDNLNLSVVTTGTGLIFQWQKDGTDLVNGGNISGVASENLVITGVDEINDGIYTCIIDGSCASTTSDLSDVVIYPTTTIIQQPVLYTVVDGGDASFSVVAEGDNLAYQWQKDGSDLSDGGVISGSATSILNLTGVAEANEGAYRCIVTGTCNISNSNPANLIVNPTSNFTTQPVDIERCVGESAGFSVVASGSGLIYQWKLNGSDLSDDAIISGVTTANLSISSVSLTDAGAYTCLINGESSSPAILTVIENTVINIQPTAKTRCEGDNVIFTVDASGSGLTYNWFRDAVDLVDGGIISGSSSETLTISSVIEADEGNYRCVVTGTCGIVNSDPAVLTIYENTLITGQPSGNTICENTSHTFSIIADGDNLIYEWRKDGVVLNDGVNISGATTNNLVVSNTDVSDAGSYTCKLTGECGFENSIIAQLFVEPNTNITLEPIDATGCAGDNISFSVLAEGAGLTYQWQKDGNIINDIGTISGTNTPNLLISGTVAADVGSYVCVVSGNCTNKNSNPAELVAYDNTQIVTQPIGSDVCEGATVTLSIAATGGNLTYQWKKDGDDLNNIGNISGVTTANLNIANAVVIDQGTYSCLVSGDCGSDNSDLTIVNVRPSTFITIHPIDKSACDADNVSFTVIANGHNLLYQWQKDGANLADAGIIAGSSTSLLSLTGVSSSDAGSYRCIVTGTCGVENSDPATLTAYQNTAIITQPVGGTICENSSITISVVATGDNLTYQWKKGASLLSDVGNITGSTTANLTINNADVSDAGTYFCSLVGSCGTINSSLANVIVEKQTQVIIHPSDAGACAGDNISFSVLAEGTNLSYQWQKDGTNLTNIGTISGVYSTSLQITGVVSGDAGSYRCVVFGNCGIQNTNPAVLSAYNNTNITIPPAGSTICESNQISLNVAATGDNLIYQWKKDGVDLSDVGNVSGTAAANLIINNADVIDAGIFTCSVSGSCGTDNSLSATMIVQKNTEITLQPQSKTTCENEVAVFSVSAIGTNLTYQWQQDGVNLFDGGNIFGATSSILTVSNTIVADAGAYRCVISGVCGSINSDAADLTVNVYPSVATAIIGPISVCQGSSNIIYEVAAIADADYYIWDLPVGVNILSGDSTRLIEVEFTDGELGGDITVKGENACGFGAVSPTLTVIANSIPIANAGSDQTICVDTSFLSAVHPGTAIGKWSVIEGPGIAQDVNLNNSYIYNLREGSNTLVWTVEKNSCLSTDTVVIINNHVAVDAGIDMVICSEDLVLDGSNVPSGATGSWSVVSGSASFDDGNDPLTIATGFTTDLNVLKWTVTKSGCSTFDTIIIDNQRPTSAYAGIDQSICSDSTVLAANNPIVGTGEWTVITGAATFTDLNNPNTTVKGLSKGDNILRWTTSNGICSTIDEVTISNNIVVVNAGIDQVLCDRTTVLDATAPVTGVGNWSVISGSASFVNNNLYNTTVTGLVQGDNILAWNINNNGCISSDSVLITNDAPSDANAGVDQVLTADFTTLQAGNPTIGSGKWSLISGSAIIADDTLYNSSVTGLALGDNVFRWTVTHNSCILTDDVIITNFMATATDAGIDQSLCSDEATLEGNEPLFGFGEWSVIQGSASFFNNSDPKTTVSGLAKGDNILRWSIWENGWTSDDVIISNDSPTESNAGVDQTICSDSTNLAGNNPIIGKGHWTVISGSGTFENDSLHNTKIINLSKGENIFKWTVTYKSCSSTDLVMVINNLPTTADAGLDQVSCLGTVSLNPNTPSIGIGEWSVLSGSANFAGNTASNLAIDDNILRWTIVNNGCSSFDDVTIINHESSDANAGANKVICYDSISLAANLPIVGTGIWTMQSGAAIISDVHSNVPDATDLNQGINVFRWTVSYNGCSKFDEVTINNALIEATTGLDQVICDESTVLEANNPGAGSGSWSVLGGSGAANFEDINQPDTRVSGLDQGDNILRWTITNEICVSHSDVVITNNLPTDAFAGPDQALCAENSILQANTPIVGVGEWSILSGSANIVEINEASSLINNLDYGVNTLRWTITNGSCISTDEVVISNNSTISSNAGIDQVLCEDSTLLYANVPTYGTGHWSVVTGSATFENNTDYNTKIIDIGKGTNTFKWVISNGGCSSSDQVVITNNSPTKAIAGGDQTICGNTTNLQGNIPTVGNGSWSLVSGAASFNNNSLNNTTVIDLNPGSNTLRWTIENSGCKSSDDVVIYNDLPYVSNAGSDFEICGNTSPLYANDPVIGIGEWTVISGKADFVDDSKFDATVTDLGFGANTLRWTITYDACTTFDEIVVINNEIDVYAGVDQEINESTTLLAASNPSTGSGQWSVIGGSGGFVQPTNSITEVYGLGSGLNTFRWSVDINGCVSYDDVSVTYNVPPDASFVITASEGCPPLDVYFVNNSLDNLPFTWDFDDGNTSDQITIKHTYTEPGVYKPSLAIVSETGDVIKKDTTIIVYDQPEASFLVVNQQVYIPEEEAIFINTSSSAITYNWDFGDGGTSAESDPKYTYTREGIYDIFLEVWSDHNCYDSLTISKGVEVVNSGVLLFPNAFTPNLSSSSGGYYNANDFSNDVFYPIGEGVNEYHLEIFNKWGILIFESKDIAIGWDGYYNEKLVNEGVYVWKVTGKLNNGKEFKEVGTILLLR
jgi:hypothetical protein